MLTETPHTLFCWGDGSREKSSYKTFPSEEENKLAKLRLRRHASPVHFAKNTLWLKKLGDGGDFLGDGGDLQHLTWEGARDTCVSKNVLPWPFL